MVGVTINSISKAFGKTKVLSDIDIDIAPGELFFLLGPSGCGKTTLLRIIAGFTEPSSGTVCFSGRDMTAVPPNQRNTGMVFQNYALWPHLTVGENVAFGLDLRHVPREEKARRVEEALALVHMSGYGMRYPHQLSGGQQQRVALARALVIRPDVVLLDEPLSNLDAGLRIEMRKEIHRIHQELGITMVYVTHDQKEALSLASRVGLMHRGVLSQVAPPDEIYQNPNATFVARFVGETNLLSGRVKTATRTELVVVTAAGLIACPADRAVRNFAAGDAVDVSIRPEGLAFGTGEPGANLWPCVVVESTYLGEVIQVVCRAEETVLRLTALNPAGSHPHPGERRMLSLNPAHIRIMSQERGE